MKIGDDLVRGHHQVKLKKARDLGLVRGYHQVKLKEVPIDEKDAVKGVLLVFCATERFLGRGGSNLNWYLENGQSNTGGATMIAPTCL